MQDLQYTPSVYFQFEDTTSKKDFADEILFQLSCTNQKQIGKPIEISLPNRIDLDSALHKEPLHNLKTEQFFEEFDNNFVVTFEEEGKNELARSELYKTGSFHKESAQLAQIALQSKVKQVKDLEKMIICEPHEEKRELALQDDFKESIKSGFSLALTKAISLNGKQSPISFEVKKRTVFKAKQNIFNNAQNFKLTKKKIINQNLFESLSSSSRSSNSSMPLQKKSMDSLTSKMMTKQNRNAKRIHFNAFEFDNKGTSSIFVDAKRVKESVRQASINTWRRRFSKERNILDDRSAKRENIFRRPELIRV